MIYFHNNSTCIGGAENLIFTIIEYASRKNIKIGLIGVDHGYLFERLKNDEIEFAFIDNTMVTNYQNFSKNDIIVLFNNFYGIEKFRNFPGYIIVWVLLYNLITSWNRFVFEKRLLSTNIISHLFNKNLINMLEKKQSLYAMDEGIVNEINKYMKRNLEIPLISIPVRNISESNKYIQFHRRSSDVINITYIGRGSDIWKIKPLKKIIADLELLAHKFKIHVFTDDDFLYRKEIKSTRIKMNFNLGYFGLKLDEELLNLSDLHFSMGTSALEASKIGVPTILLDASIKDFPVNYRYNWIFNSKGYSLGRFLNGDTINKGYTMNQIIESYLNNKIINEVSEKSLKYTWENHNIQKTFEKIISSVPQASAKDILKFTPAAWFQ